MRYEVNFNNIIGGTETLRFEAPSDSMALMHKPTIAEMQDKGYSEIHLYRVPGEYAKPELCIPGQYDHYVQIYPSE